MEEISIEKASGAEEHPLEKVDSFEEHMRKDINDDKKAATETGSREVIDGTNREEFVGSLRAEGSEKIRQIGEMLLSESDIIAKHGTSINNAMSILKTGFNYDKTSMAIQKTDNITRLCAYGWKNNSGGDAANVVLSIPKSFFKDLYGWDEQTYDNWADGIKKQELQQDVIDGMSNKKYEQQKVVTSGMSNMKFGGLPALPPKFTATLPKEFVRGALIFTDGKNYLSFLNNEEEALNYLTYVDNPGFYENLSLEEKEKFISRIRETVFKKD